MSTPADLRRIALALTEANEDTHRKRPAFRVQTRIFALLGVMTVLAIWRPEVERVGALGIPTTRGDRLFLSLLGAAFIHLAWLGLAAADLWWATGLSLLFAALVFRFV